MSKRAIRALLVVLPAAALLLGWGSSQTSAETKFWHDDNGPGWVCEHPPERPSEKVCRPASGGSPSPDEPTPCENLHQSWVWHSEVAITADEDLPLILAGRDDDVQAWAFNFAASRYARALERGCEWATG